MGHGKPGKSWNFRISFYRPEKASNLIVGHAGFEEVMENLESHGILEFHFPGVENHGV